MYKDLKMKSPCWLILLVLFFLFPESFSQSYILKKYTTDEGLTHNNVRQMLTDKEGFLWISTWDGLNRYDGYEFRQYHHIPGDTTSFPFFSLNDMALDRSDNLWILADNGKVVKYNRESDNFSNIIKVDREPLPIIMNILNDNREDLWMISGRCLFRYMDEEHKFKKYRIVFPDTGDSLRTGLAYKITRNGSKEIWLTGTGVYRLEIEEEQDEVIIREQYSFQFNMEVPGNRLRNSDHNYWAKLFISGSGSKWIFTNEGLYRLDNKTLSFIKFTKEIPGNEFDGCDFCFWGNDEGGINIYRKETGTIAWIPPDIAGLIKNATYQGRNMVWFSFTTLSGNPGGLGRIIFTPDYFRKYSPATESDNLPAVYSLTKDKDDNLWLGIRGRDHIIEITPENKRIVKKTPMTHEPGYYGPVRTMISTPEGIWLGYFYGMLLFYDYKTGKFQHHYPQADFFRALAAGKDNKLYTGNDKLTGYDARTGISEDLAGSIKLQGLFRLTVDSTGILWGAMPSCQFMRYDPENNEIKIFKPVNGPYNIEDVCPVSDDEVWLALLGGGLVKFNPLTNESKSYTTSSGLSNNTTYSILRDKTGHIWVSTDNGISRLNPETGIIKKFGIAEGLDIVEFNSGASYTDDEGRFYFGGMGGAVSFHPDSINMLESIAAEQKIILTRFTISGRYKILPQPLNRTDTLVLYPGENNFQLSFSASNFANSSKTLYRYRLMEQDGDWNTSEVSMRYANYANLHPGIYNLRIEATDTNGEWSAFRNMVIDVRPKFIQTFFFKVLIIILLLGISHIIVSLYLRNYRQKASQVQDQLRLQALRGQMNPHFIFNSLNSINYFISENDKLSANRYIADFSRLIRSILSNMGKDYITFDEELSSIRDYLEIEHLRFGDSFDFEINTNGLEDGETIEVFPGLVQPFIENAIWHGIRAIENRKAHIRVTFMPGDRYRIRCTVEDNGIGRKASMELRKNSTNHDSKGISIVSERLQIISKLRSTEYYVDISDLYPGINETGTVVKIDIPVRAGKN